MQRSAREALDARLLDLVLHQPVLAHLARHVRRHLAPVDEARAGALDRAHDRGPRVLRRRAAELVRRALDEAARAPERVHAPPEVELRRERRREVRRARLEAVAEGEGGEERVERAMELLRRRPLERVREYRRGLAHDEPNARDWVLDGCDRRRRAVLDGCVAIRFACGEHACRRVESFLRRSMRPEGLARGGSVLCR